MLHLWKTRTFRIGAIVVLLIGLYALLGFVVAPRLVRSALLEDIPKNIAATPTVGAIRINPFLFQATIDDFALTGRGGDKLLGFQRLFIDFQLSSIWHRAYTFANIDLTAPHVSALIAADGRLNLLQLVPKPSAQPKPAPAASEPLPALRIGSFKVSSGLVTYDDRSRADPFAARLEPINFELRDFTTGVEGGRFTLTGASKLGERVEWHGHVSVDPVESDGEFQINGLLAHTIWEYLQDQVSFIIDKGSIDVAGTYKFSLKDPKATDLQVDVSKVALTDFAVKPKTTAGDGADSEWVSIPALNVTGTSVDVTHHHAHVDLVSLTGVKLLAWLEADGNVNLMRLAGSPGTPPAGTPPAGAVAPPTSAGLKPAAPALTASTASGAEPAAGTPWGFELSRFELRDASISAEDRSVSPAVKVVLAPLSIQVDGASQDLAKPVKVALDVHINDKGSFALDGSVTPQPAVADVAVKFSDIDLTVLQPYLSKQTAMTLMAGRLGGDAKVHYGTQPKTPGMQVAGNVSVTGLHTVDDALHDDFINWERLDITGLSYSKSPDRLDIEQILARKLYARVIVESDDSINVKRVLKIPTVVAVPGPDGATAAAVPVAKPVAKPVKKGGAQVQAAAAPMTPVMPMSIKKVVVQDSQASFTDLSIKPDFSAGIHNLEGSVLGLSSKPASRAKVDLKGSVEAFSPVSITGEVNVLGPLYTDLSMSFRNISLAVFNPYSGKFAGYNITKGKLSTELHYKVDGRKLDAQHHIVVEQLEFGDKTESKEAVSLPIKLAISLLKDRNGVIDLNIPVTGSLDDPKFRLAPIIWKVLVDNLEKAVMAPFALLGSLFGGGPDIQFVTFEPGVGTLDPAGTDKAKTVAKALIERPQLKIDVPIGVVADVDGPALAGRQYDARLKAAMAAQGGSKKAGATAPVSFDQLDASTQADLLSHLYAKEFGSEPKYPDTVTTLKSKPDVAAAKIDFLSKAIRGHIVVADADLQALGQQRAIALQTVLLADSQIDAERVFLVANDKAVAKGGQVELELSLR